MDLNLAFKKGHNIGLENFLLLDDLDGHDDLTLFLSCEIRSTESASAQVSADIKVVCCPFTWSKVKQREDECGCKKIRMRDMSTQEKKEKSKDHT